MELKEMQQLRKELEVELRAAVSHAVNEFQRNANYRYSKRKAW